MHRIKHVIFNNTVIKKISVKVNFQVSIHTHLEILHPLRKKKEFTLWMLNNKKIK